MGFVLLHTYPTSCANTCISHWGRCPMSSAHLSTRWSELRVGRISLADHFAGGRMLQEPHWRDAHVGRRRQKIPSWVLVLRKSGDIPARWTLMHSPRAIQSQKVPANEEKKSTWKRKTSIYSTVEPLSQPSSFGPLAESHFSSSIFEFLHVFSTCSPRLSLTKTDPLNIMRRKFWDTIWCLLMPYVPIWDDLQ